MIVWKGSKKKPSVIKITQVEVMKTSSKVVTAVGRKRRGWI